MKARIFTTALLMVVALATYAQTSRRGEREKEKSTRTEEKKNNDNRSERKVETQKRSDQPAETKQETHSRRESTNTQQRTETRENTGTTNTQTRTEPKENSGNTSTQTRTDSRRNSGDNTVKPTENQDQGTTSRRGDNRNDNKDNTIRPEGNQGNQGNNTYNSGESRRGDGRTTVSTQQRREPREYVQVNHNPRKVVVVNHPRSYKPVSVEYRRQYHPYRAPVRREVYWEINIRNNFRIYYPEVRYWRYDEGYRLPLAPAYDAIDYVGDVARIYGKVFETYYEYENDEYFLYFGDYYPYHDFTVIVPGVEARKLSRRPDRLFRRSHLEVTGYITMFDDKPEMVIRNARQIEVY